MGDSQSIGILKCHSKTSGISKTMPENYFMYDFQLARQREGRGQIFSLCKEHVQKT